MARPQRQSVRTRAAVGPQVRTTPLEEAAARGCLAHFAEHVLGIRVGPHHRAWAELVRDHKRVDIEAARGHGKSGFFSYAYPLWQMWKNPGSYGLIVSATQSQVEGFFEILKNGKHFVDEDGFEWSLPAVADIPLLQHMVPSDYQRSWTGAKITMTNGSRLIGRSFGTKFRGFHGQFIVVDDPHGDEVTFSEVVRNRDHDFLTRSLMPMLLPAGQMVIVGTPLHDDDIHGRNAKNSEWAHAKFPAFTVVKGERIPLWPEFRPLAWLDAQGRSMSTIAFRQEYLLIPASNEASLFPDSLFRDRRETLASWLRIRPTADEIRAREDWTYFAGVDLAYSTSDADTDYTVVVVLGVDPRGNMHTVEVVRSRGLWFREQMSLIEDTLAPYHQAGKLALAYIEANQLQRIFGDEFAYTTALPVRPFTTTAQKNNIASGVPSLRLYLENGKLRIARGDFESREATDVLIAEMQAFGWHKGKLQGVGAHDDTVMALWIATMAVRRGAGTFYEMLDTGAADYADPALAEDAAQHQAEERGPWMPLPNPRLTAADLDGADGLRLMARHGYIPAACVLSPADGAAYVYRAVEAGRSPCWGCSADRAKCGGLPMRDAGPLAADARLAQAAGPVVQPAGAWASNPAPAPADGGRSAVVRACGGDTALAGLIPADRGLMMAGFRALYAGTVAPPWVSTATTQGKADALYDALEALLS